MVLQVWADMVWFGVVQHGQMLFGVVQHGQVWWYSMYDVVQYGQVQ